MHVPPDAGESERCSHQVVRVVVSGSINMIQIESEVEPEVGEIVGTRDQLLGHALQHPVVPASLGIQLHTSPGPWVPWPQLVREHQGLEYL